MNKIIPALLVCLLSFSAFAKAPKNVAPPAPVSMTFRAIRYDGKLAEDEARFTLDIDAEATASGESSGQLLEGDVAILPGKLPDQLKIVREGNRYLLIASHPGQIGRAHV